MKYIWFILSLFCSIAHAERIDFILDIDGVLVDRANKEAVAHLYPPEVIKKLEAQNRVFRLNGHTYILNHGAGEFIDYLASIPDAKITFFSTGPADRNEIFLKHFKTASGRRFIDVAEGRFLSYDKAIRIAEDGQAFFSGDFEAGKLDEPLYKKFQSKLNDFSGPVKKDITLINGLDLKSAILVDDRIVNATGGQEKNLLKVDIDLTRQNPEEVLRYLDGNPTNRGVSKTPLNVHYYNWKNRLMLVAGMIDAAITNADNKKIALRDALWNLQWQTDNKGKLVYKLNGFKPQALFQRGEELFYDLNKKFRAINLGIYFCNSHQIYRY